MRRWIALGVGLIVLIAFVLGVRGCMNSQKHNALRSYARNLSNLIDQGDRQISAPLFQTLFDAQGKPQIQVETTINNARLDAQDNARQAAALNPPGDVAAAQRVLLLALDLRTEALGKLTSLVGSALAGNGGAQSANANIAGEMEVLLSSDVLYEVRVVPLVEQALRANGITDVQPRARSQFLPNTGWLDPATVASRLAGTGGSGGTGGSNTACTGVCGHRLDTVSVGSNTLASGVLNHVAGAGAGVTFSVAFTNTGSQAETNVGVTVTVSAAGHPSLTATKTIDRTTPGSQTTAQIPLSASPPTGVPTRVTVAIQKVPGEANVANNRATYPVVFAP